MKKTTEKVSYLNYCLYICGVMKDDGFHRTKRNRTRNFYS